VCYFELKRIRAFQLIVSLFNLTAGDMDIYFNLTAGDMDIYFNLTAGDMDN
jgi:hypothetical protein